MNAQFAVLVVTFLAIFWPLWRFYKKISRRCCEKGCGSITMIKRRQCIFLPPEEYNLSFPLVLKGTPRWFIRRVVKVTLTECTNSAKHTRKIKLVKIDMDPISLWHAHWVKWFHKEQYYPEIEYRRATKDFLRQMYYKDSVDLKGSETDSPDFDPIEWV